MIHPYTPFEKFIINIIGYLNILYINYIWGIQCWLCD